MKPDRQFRDDVHSIEQARILATSIRVAVMFGYYGDGLALDTVVAPRGWTGRLVVYESENTNGVQQGGDSGPDRGQPQLGGVIIGNQTEDSSGTD